MLSRRTFLAATAVVLSLAPALAEDHPEKIHIHDAYARTMGGIGASGAAFFVVHNNATTDDRLIGARSDVAEMVQLHTHIMNDQGVMQMVEVKEGFPLPAGEMHELKRGGDHVMLMGLTRELKDGDAFPLTLIFESGAEVTLDITIDNARMPEEMDHSDHGTGG
jgi:copper(I)-binding protein